MMPPPLSIVDEADATGTVAAVYGHIRLRLPMVPSLFKLLATCPPYLVLAWRQADPVLDTEAVAAASTALGGSVAAVTTPPMDEGIRQTVAPLVGPLGKMLLLSAGLLCALHGELDGAAAEPDPPDPVTAAGKRTVPPGQQDGDPLFDRIQSSLRTPIVHSMWRALANRGQLDGAWAHFAPQVPAALAAGEGLRADALAAAKALRWPVVAGPASIAAAGVTDAVPAITSTLNIYVDTLPPVLALAASSAD